MDQAARAMIELNIKHYRELLKTERDVDKRESIMSLLAEEEKKLTPLPEEGTT